jgi:hypothetical protein
MFISQTSLTYFYKWPITCEIQILNLIEFGSGICNRCDQRLFLLASRFFRLAKRLWNQGKGMQKFAVVPIEVLLKYWFNTLPRADQLISSSSSRYLYTS